MKAKLRKGKKGWWVLGVKTTPDRPFWGPYETKKEAEKAKQLAERLWKDDEAK